jgi:hypothetical protein
MPLLGPICATAPQARSCGARKRQMVAQVHHNQQERPELTTGRTTRTENTHAGTQASTAPHTRPARRRTSTRRGGANRVPKSRRCRASSQHGALQQQSPPAPALGCWGMLRHQLRPAIGSRASDLGTGRRGCASGRRAHHLAAWWAFAEEEGLPCCV